MPGLRGSAAWRFLFLVALLLLAAGNAADASTRVQIPPLILDPPTSCSRLPVLASPVAVMGVQRIRLVWTGNGYQAWIGSCATTGGIDDAQLVPGPFLPGRVQWGASRTFTVRGRPVLPGGFNLVTDPAPGLVGTLPGTDVTITTNESSSPRRKRSGLGVRTAIAKHPTVADNRRLIDLQGMRVTVEQSAQDPQLAASVDFSVITYQLAMTSEPDPTPTTSCPPQSSTTSFAFASADGPDCVYSGCHTVTTQDQTISSGPVCSVTVDGQECMQQYTKIVKTTVDTESAR